MSVYDVAHVIPCGFCLSAANESCTTISGRKATAPHTDRTQRVQTIWNDGFHEGQRDILSAVDDDTPWSKQYLEQVGAHLLRGGAS